MIVISSREFKNNAVKYFNRADKGDTPQMLAKIDRALAQAERGEGVSCKTYEESLKFLESL